MGELAALGKRCLHFRKSTCALRKLNLTENCHCNSWEASAEYIRQMEEEAALRRAERLK